MEQDALTSPPRPGRLQRMQAVLRQPAVLVAAIALALFAWQWFETRSRIADLQQEVARRLAAGDATGSEARALAKQSQEALVALHVKTGMLEAQLAESQGQQAALDAMVQELTRNRDERLMAEIEQALNTAAQQLQLAGNVEAALIALQGADLRLAAAARARFLPLRKLVARDIERLKSLPLADVPGIALRIDGIAMGVDAMPLAFEATPQAESAPATFVAASVPGYWEKLFGDLWHELKSLIRVERLDRPDSVLLSPPHAFFLRENLKLRLMAARLTLLARDGKTFRQDVKQAQAWIERYFDLRDRKAQSALATLKQLAAADVGLVAMPSLEESLTALRNYKVAREQDSTPAPSRPQGGTGGR